MVNGFEGFEEPPKGDGFDVFVADDLALLAALSIARFIAARPAIACGVNFSVASLMPV